MPAAAEPPSPEPVAGAGPGAMWWCSCPAWDIAADTIIAKITHIMAKEAIDLRVWFGPYYLSSSCKLSDLNFLN